MTRDFIPRLSTISISTITEPWVLRTHVGPRNIIAARHDNEGSARAAYKKTLWTAVLVNPDGEVVSTKPGLLDRAGLKHVEMLSRVDAGPTDFARQWALGKHCWGGVSWETFDTEDAARKQFKRTPWSKVLFDPDGIPVVCATELLDKQGAGVAAILQVFRHNASRSSCQAVLKAMAQGRAPFVPRTARAGWNLKGEVLKRVWQALASRAVLSHMMPKSICYFDADASPMVKGFVALTIDDAPCRLGRDNSMMRDVMQLLAEHKAKATFMVMGKFVRGNEDDLVALLEAGHELGNHGLVDRPYHKDSKVDVDAAVTECSEQIRCLQRRAGVPEEVRWFRAPHGRMSGAMEEVLEEHGLGHVMCDTYACCPVVQDADFIGNYLGNHASDGSVILIHMPEKGFREWCFDGLRICLERLRERGLQAVTVGELSRAAQDARGAAPLGDDASS